MASSASKKANNAVQRVLFYSVTATGTFYIGSTFASYQNQQCPDVFTEHVPLVNVLVEYGESTIGMTLPCNRSSSLP